MLAMIMSTLFFVVLICMGNILMFLQPAAYLLVPCFFGCLLVCTVFYKDANCKSLEGKDFLICLVMVIVFAIIYDWADGTLILSVYCYLYLSTFLAFILFADSKRFKSLM